LNVNLPVGESISRMIERTVVSSKTSRPRVLSVCLPSISIRAVFVLLSLHGHFCHGLQPHQQQHQHRQQQQQQTMREIQKANNSLVGRSVLDGCDCDATDSNDNTTTRRKLVRRLFGAAMTTTALVNLVSPSLSSASTTTTTTIATKSITTTTAQNDDDSIRHPFVYSDSWKGTNLNRMSLEDATKSDAYTREYKSGDGGVCCYWTMGKWPDPALRIPAKPVDPSLWLEGAASSVEQQQQQQQQRQTRLQLAASILRDTARREGAVGLAAQQCGVDARMVFLSSSWFGGVGSLFGKHNHENDNDMVLINPRIVARSPESSMKVWTEECLVLPPTFRATILRDDWIDVEYDVSFEYRSQQQPGQNDRMRTQTQMLGPSSEELLLVVVQQLSSEGSSQNSTPIRRRFVNEQSRCLQHELDHDRGILITDHVGLEELENNVMRQIEAEGHDRRQVLAYSRQ
jgi:peptide deformylase